MIAHLVPLYLVLCALAGGQALFAQESPAPGAPYASVDGGKAEPQARGNSADDHSKSSYQYVDRFSGPSWAVDPKHPVDFEWSGRNSINDFRPEPRDVFHMMDQVVTEVTKIGPDNKPVLDADNQPIKERKLMPLQFNVTDAYDPSNPDQQAVFGRNTWMLWCGGDEDFWDWLAQRGYGVLDFLQAIDSRRRATRLHDLGLINQPGLKRTTMPGPWGLYIDTVESKIGVEGNYSPAFGSRYDSQAEAYKDPQGRTLKSDGVDPVVYGYPSGVIGLRLFPNPNFFIGPDAKSAQARWNAEAFYNDHAYATDPRTVRPFTVGMSCAICHVSTHPLNPPANAEEPQWSNLSSIVGAQYFRTSGIIGSRVERTNFLWQYLASQQPGTIDTSMTATDQINNANAMNAIFEMPARVARAQLNPAEIQGLAAQSIPLGPIQESERKIPRVLMDGADSIGLFAALNRVYLNIGLFHDEWNRDTNTVIGFTPQKPFSIDVCRRNSLYWRVNENFRIGYLAAFFLWDKKSPTEPRTKAEEPRFQCSTQAMLLQDALIPSVDGTSGETFVPPPTKDHPEGTRVIPHWNDPAALWDEPAALRGGKVFAENCMVCHSSKQPAGYEIAFAHEPPKGAKSWRDVVANDGKLTMPYAGADWENFKKSPAYRDYLARAIPLSGEGDWGKMREFLKDNYLSTDLRIPVSLTETNSARAVGTNALKGHVWSEFASDTYQSLPPVGKLTYTDPITRQDATYEPPGNGPGYYRVPSLVSIWMSAPLLHNNSLGFFIADDLDLRISVKGRLDMFDDAINKLLWKAKRGLTPSGLGGLRGATDATWHGLDPGWIYRTDVESELRIPSGHLRHLVTGVLPGVLPGLPGIVALMALDVPWLAPLLLTLLSLALIFCWPRGFFYLVLLSGLLVVLVLWITGIHYLLPAAIWLLPLALMAGGLAWIVTMPHHKKAMKEKTNAPSGTNTNLAAKWRCTGFRVARWGGVMAYVVLLIGLLAVLWTGREFVDGHLGDLDLGPFPKGIPVNVLMNFDPESSLDRRLAALRGLCDMLGTLRAADEKERASEEARRVALENDPSTPEDKLPRLYRLSDADRLEVFEQKAGPALMAASKCPDFVLDRGHYFGEALTDQEKTDLIAFLKIL
jgi:hypothetical protein